MSHYLKDQIAIVGIGKVPTRDTLPEDHQDRLDQVPGSTPLSLGIAAFRNALDDAGLEKSKIDGILTHPGTAGGGDHLSFAQAVGVNPRLSTSFSHGGSSGGALVEYATLAVHAGMADYVACIFGDSARTGGVRFGGAMGGGGQAGGMSQGIWGMFGPAANSALGARRHMALYGTTSEQLGHVAVSTRRYANANPDAVFHDRPLTLEEHQESRWIVEPMHLFDCCQISDGGVCIIVTTAERAKELRQPAVLISGIGQAYTARTYENDDWWYLIHQRRALADAFAMAEVTTNDIDVAELYDNFTISVLFWLEHAGFVGLGEAGPFVEEGNLGPDGALPTNTAGGNLSESYMEGWLHIYEGVRQMRGTSTSQVEDAEVCLTTGRGMNLNTSNALVLRRGT
jgi:acetyl-CoA acetyltransferase